MSEQFDDQVEPECIEVYEIVETSVQAELTVNPASTAEEFGEISDARLESVLRQVVIRGCRERAPEQLKALVLARLRELR